VTAAVKNIIIVCVSVIVGFFIINGFIQNKNNKKINKELAKIERYKLKEAKYIDVIKGLKNNLLTKDTVIAVLEEKANELSYSIWKLEQIKTTKRDGTIIEIKNIDTFDAHELDSFFTNRFKNISENSIN
jgi:hypothetical protein